jgi:hypothetical protein
MHGHVGSTAPVLQCGWPVAHLSRPSSHSLPLYDRDILSSGCSYINVWITDFTAATWAEDKMVTQQNWKHKAGYRMTDIWADAVSKQYKGRAVAQVVSRRFSIPAARVWVQVKTVGSVVDRAAMGQVSSEYFGFPCHSIIPLHWLLHRIALLLHWAMCSPSQNYTASMPYNLSSHMFHISEF